MPFKVVQTMERGSLRLTSVPDQWEKNGTLFWPKNKQEKLRRQENCNPDPTWASINCIVKRKKLRTFKDAEAEIDAMSDRSDTETDNEHRFQTKTLSATLQRESLAKSFNKMAQELVENNDQEASTAATYQQETVTPDESYVAALNIVQSQQPNVFEDISLETENVDEQGILILNQDIQMQQMQEDIQTIKQDVKTILNNQNALFELQNKLILKHSEFQTQLEQYIKLSSKSQAQIQDDAIEIIKTLNDLEDFEKNLSDAILKQEYRKKLRGLCNRGAGKGTSNAYYLIDHLFDREFLKGCSWTGSTKKENDTVKICFKAFQKTINFFFDIIKETDETFTKADCEKFFKIVLKNARQRCESNKRTSASRQRIKGKKTMKNAIETSSVSPITAEQSDILDQPAPANHALLAPEPSPEHNQRGVANVAVINQSHGSAAVQPKN